MRQERVVLCLKELYVGLALLVPELTAALLGRQELLMIQYTTFPSAVL